jgi:DnaJ like chaperone protein
MSWLKAGVFGGLGMLIGGPIGAGIGIAVGSAMGGEKSHVSLEAQNQLIYFTALFSMLGKIAKADGQVSQEEVAVVSRFMDEMGLREEHKQIAIKIFNDAKINTYSIYDYASQYSEVAGHEMRVILYATLWNVALSDGVIHPKEDEILRKIPGFLKIEASYYDEYSLRAPSDTGDVNKSYALLGCEVGDSDSEIKRKYRYAVSEYHPDKIQSKGLPDGFMKFANEQTQKINEAYSVVMESRKNL